MPELPENVENAILDAELTPDEKLVAEEQAQEQLESVVDIKSETPEEPRDLPQEPAVDPQPSFPAGIASPARGARESGIGTRRPQVRPVDQRP